MWDISPLPFLLVKKKAINSDIARESFFDMDGEKCLENESNLFSRIRTPRVFFSLGRVFSINSVSKTPLFIRTERISEGKHLYLLPGDMRVKKYSDIVN